jgi:magnesium transporter
VNSSFITYALIDDVTNRYVPFIKYLEKEIDMIDELVLILKASDLVDMLQRISVARKKVMILTRLINNKPDLTKLVANRLKQPSSELLLHMEDVYDCAVTMRQDLSQYETSLARCHSHYLAQISIEITQASNRGNELTTKMTVLASVLVPLNIITGLWGMNVHVPGQDDTESFSWFFGIILGMIFVSSATAILIWFLKIKEKRKNY